VAKDFLWAAPVLLALAGCETITNARDAQDDAKAAPGERTPTAAEIGLPTSGPLTLEQVVDAALAVNPAILQARHQAENAEAAVGAQEGAFWPSIGTGVGQDGYKYETLNTPGKNPQTNIAHSFYSAGFSVSWLLYDFGKTPALLRQVAALSLAAQRTLRSTEVTTAFQARSAYFNLVKQFELLRVAEDTYNDFLAHRDQTHEFVKAGTRVPYDESKATLDMLNAKLTLIKQRDAVDSAQATLANAIGIAEVTSWVPAEVEPLPPFRLTFDEAWSEAHKNQPALLAALAQEQGAKDFVDAQIAALYPSITASAGYGANGNTFPLTWNWNFGPSVSWVLFNGFTNYYTIDEATASLRAARANKASVEQTVWLNLRTAWVALKDAEERIDTTEQEVLYGKQTLDFANERYKVGRATSVDVADAQASYAQALSDHVSAKADYNTAIANLWQALGVTKWTR
jgi:outer membrane protein